MVNLFFSNRDHLSALAAKLRVKIFSNGALLLMYIIVALCAAEGVKADEKPQIIPIAAESTRSWPREYTFWFKGECDTRTGLCLIDQRTRSYHGSAEFKTADGLIIKGGFSTNNPIWNEWMVCRNSAGLYFRVFNSENQDEESITVQYGLEKSD